MSRYFPNVTAATPPARPLPGTKPKGKYSASGKLYGTGQKGLVDPNGLEEWEGVSTFRDARSPTGWIDFKGHVIAGTDDRGVVLLPLKDDPSRWTYYDGHESHGGLHGSLGSALGIFGGDFLGLGLELTGNQSINTPRIAAGALATGGILASGGFGADTLGGLFGGGAEGGGGSMPDLSDILSTGGTDGVPSWLQGLGGAIDEGLDIYGRIQGAFDHGDEPSSSSGAGGYQSGAPAGGGGRPSWLMPALIVGGGLVLLLILRKK